MRTIQAANQLIRKQAWDRKTRWTWNGPDDDLEVQDGRFKQLDSTAEGSYSAYRFAPATPNEAPQSSKEGRRSQDFLLKPRQVVLQTTRVEKPKEGGTNVLITSNSLPPICGSRVPSLREAKSCVSSQHALETGKKAGVSSNGARSVRTLICRQKERAQLTSTVDVICRSLAPFRVTESTQDSASPPPRTEEKCKKAWMKRSVMTHTQSRIHRSFEKKNLSSNDSGVITERMKDSVSGCETKRHSQQFSDSAFETETQSSHRKREEDRNREVEDEEEVYYTTKMIAEWIIRVNASLFSPFKDELNKTHLKEEDVDTIKIIYGQD